MHHANMVRNMVAGLQEFLQKYQAPTENAISVSEPVDYVENALKSTQQQLDTQLKQT